MKINVKKSGKWAHRGIEIVDVIEGIQDYQNSLANELIGSGWAVPYEEIKEAKNIFPKVEQKSRGWWSVSFDEIKHVSIRGAESEEEAILMAKEKLEKVGIVEKIEVE